MNLPNMGPSNKTIYLPDDTTLQASAKTMLPFTELSSKAREADIIPGLTRPLMSVNKMANEGYTTVFHPRNKGVTVHAAGTIKILTTAKPVLTGTYSNGLWSIPPTTTETLKMQTTHTASRQRKGRFVFYTLQQDSPRRTHG
jgi:hypothetical protein